MRFPWIELVGALAGALLLSRTVTAADAAALASEAEERMRALLGELVAADGTAPPEDRTEPPEDEARAVAVAARRLREAKVPFQIREFAPGRENLVAWLPGGREKPLLLLAHTDVAGAAAGSGSTDPRELTERNGHLYGRGVFDDLGRVAIAIEVLAALKAADVPLRRDVVLALTDGAGSGGAGIRSLLENDPAAIEAAVALNEGGRVIRGEDGKVRLVELAVAEKIAQRFQLSVEGPTGPSSVPADDDPIRRLADALARIGGTTFPVRLLPLTRAYFRARAAVEEEPVAGAMRTLAEAKDELPVDAVATLLAEPAHAGLLRTTCFATAAPVVRRSPLPARAAAIVDCQILPDETVAATRETLVRVVGDPRVAVTPVGVSHVGPASPSDGSHPDAVRRVVARMWPGVPVIPSLSAGATDSRFLRAAGTDAYGLHPIPVTETDAHRADGADERIPVDGLRTGFELLYRLVIELAAAR